jgi:uncharacterized membrane protein (UPF0127 family)
VRAAALLFAGLLAGCSASTAPHDGGATDAGAALRVPVTVAAAHGDVTFQAELADTPDERTRGLMFREQMDDEHGMLFLFPDEQQRAFWMKNTLISLDMIFIRSDHTILGVVHEATPKTTVSRQVPGNSQFVLEINGGRAAALGIEAGQEVRFVVPLPDR